LVVEEFDALGQRLGGRQHRRGGGIAVGGGPASGQRCDQRGGAVAAVAVAQLGRRGNQQRVDLVGRRGAGLDRAAACGQQRAQGGGVSVFGHGQAIAGQGGASGGVGIYRVGFAPAAACGPIGAAHLGHLDLRGLQHPGQARAVTRDAFHPGHLDGAKALGPPERGLIARWACREFGVCQGFPASVMTAKWTVSRWVSAPMTTRRDAVTMVMSPLVGDR